MEQKNATSSSCSFMNDSETKGQIFISLPSSCLSVLEGARPLNARQFSERGANEEAGSTRVFSFACMCNKEYLRLTALINFKWRYILYVDNTFCRSPQRCTDSESSVFSLVRCRRSCCAKQTQDQPQMLFNPLFILQNDSEGGRGALNTREEPLIISESCLMSWLVLVMTLLVCCCMECLGGGGGEKDTETETERVITELLQIKQHLQICQYFYTEVAKS